MTMLSVEAQMSYLVQWFTEWSELQRTDFLPVLAEKMTNIAYVNGIVNSIAGVNCQDKPMSLFECRVCIYVHLFIDCAQRNAGVMCICFSYSHC